MVLTTLLRYYFTTHYDALLLSRVVCFTTLSFFFSSLDTPTDVSVTDVGVTDVGVTDVGVNCHSLANE